MFVIRFNCKQTKEKEVVIMKIFKGYKGVALIYLIVTLVNVIWVVNYEKPADAKQVSKERNVVLNA